MKQRLFNPGVEPRCANCSRGRLLATGSEILCVKKGIVDKDYVCKKYAYDPLKREPSVLRAQADFKPDDFVL